MQVFISYNLAMFQDIIVEEQNIFVEKISKAYIISDSLIKNLLIELYNE